VKIKKMISHTRSLSLAAASSSLLMGLGMTAANADDDGIGTVG